MGLRLASVCSAVLLATACGGGGGGTTSSGGSTTGKQGTTNGATTGPGTTNGGTSTGAATTTGGTPGGTTGGTTGATGGATTGGTTGGGLADGAPCTSNAACNSAVCGINGSGNCCSAACATGDATCGATACDNTGACTYPASTISCGTDSCSGSQLTQSDCDGSGTCTANAAVACPGNLNCNDASSCLATCGGDGDCTTGFYCSSGTCLAVHALGACDSNSACTSNVCGISGTGDCCTATCAPTVDPACTAKTCDAATGACVYAVGATCSGTCSGNTLTAGVCDATGACGVPDTASCPGNLMCNAGGTGCLTTCTQLSDCANGFFCSGGTCVAQLAAGGTCKANTDCSTGICGVNGAGHCCTATCSTDDATCGATDCDNAGACSYPSAKTVCGKSSCSAGTQTDAANCDGAGTCSAPGTTDCSPFVCGATACLTVCSDTPDCTPGDFCDVDTGNGACCSGLLPGGIITVDSVTGSDATGCCGFNGAGACQSLSHVMRLIDTAQATGVTIIATVNGGGGDWNLKSEPFFPITLGWGAELSAPGVYFMNPAKAPKGGVESTAIFVINAVSTNDLTGYASIVGDAKNPVNIGMSSIGTQTDADSVIRVEASNTLYVANASVNGSFNNFTNFAGFLMEAGSTLDLGEDQSGAITGTVNIGNALGNQATDGWAGIVMDGTGGCTIKDAALTGVSSVVIQGQEGGDMVMIDSNVTLTSSPVFGLPPTGVGFNTCPVAPKGDAQNVNATAGIEFQGLGTLTLQNAVLQCIDYNAIHTIDDAAGAPTVSIDSTVIQNTQQAIFAEAGTVTVTNSTIQFNGLGVEQSGTSTVDLSGGNNTVVCSSNLESGAIILGVSVYNNTSAPMAADNVAWDTVGPDYFDCNGTFGVCTCNLSSCAVPAGNDGMDAVEDSTALGGVSTTNPTLSSITCD